MKSIYFKNIIALKRLYMNDLNRLSVVEDKAFSNVVGRNAEEDSGKNETNCFSLFLYNCPALNEIQDGAFDATSLCMVWMF